MTEHRNRTDGSFPPGPWLEIVRGKTKFPCRPFSTDRFLIGAGSQCDLQLGGETTPMLHSLIVVTETETTIEAFHPAPPMLVNGIPSRTANLSHGDRLQVGRVELRFHRPSSATSAAPDSDDVAGGVGRELAHVDPQWERQVGGMPLSELIDRIEDEQRAVRSFEGRRSQGARALLEAIQNAGVAPVPALEAAVPGHVRFLNDIQVAEEGLAERERRVREYEEALTARAGELAEVQERLAMQIDQVRERMRQIDQDGTEPLRISA